MDTVLVRVKVRPGGAGRVRPAAAVTPLSVAGGRSRAASTCVQIGAEDPNDVLLIETFDSPESYRAHRESPRNQEFVAGIRSQFAGPPEATAWYPADS